MAACVILSASYGASGRNQRETQMHIPSSNRVLATTLGDPSPAYKQEAENVGAWAVAHASQAAMPYGAVATKAMRVL
jgi:hypothetical protein